MPAYEHEHRTEDGAETTTAGRVLVIDDEFDVADLVRETLCDAGFEVDVSTTPQDGLERARAVAYDAVLTDLGMPGMSGIEVAKALREERPALPVVLVTGWGQSAARAGGEGLVFDVIPKPFELDEVVRVTARACRSRSAPAHEPPDVPDPL